MECFPWLTVSRTLFSVLTGLNVFAVRVLLSHNAVSVSGVQRNDLVIHTPTLTLFPPLATTEYWVEFPVLPSRFCFVIYRILYTAVVFLVHPRLPKPSLPHPLITVGFFYTCSSVL